MVPMGLLGSFGLQELVLVLLIVIFLFGARKIPEIARGLGEGIRGFRTSLRGGDDDGHDEGEAGAAPKKSKLVMVLRVWVAKSSSSRVNVTVGLPVPGVTV